MWPLGMKPSLINYFPWSFPRGIIMCFITVNQARVCLGDLTGKTGESICWTVQVLLDPNLLLTGNIRIIITFRGQPPSSKHFLL